MKQEKSEEMVFYVAYYSNHMVTFAARGEPTSHVDPFHICGGGKPWLGFGQPRVLHPSIAH